MTQAIEAKPVDPPETVRQMLRAQVDVTTRLLGTSYAGNLRQWLETYEQFLAIYTDPALRRSVKLSRFNDLFRAMFIDRHPAYPLYRHWYNLVEQSPEFIPPVAVEPTPRITTEIEEAQEAAHDINEPRPFVRIESSDEADENEDTVETTPRRGGRGVLLLVIGLLVLVVIAAVILTRGNSPDSGSPLNPTPVLPTVAVVSDVPTDIIPVALSTDEATATTVPTNEPTVQATIVPAALATNTDVPPTDPPLPTETSVPTETFTPVPTDTPLPTFTPSPTLPPTGLHGQQDLLRVVEAQTAPPWTGDEFLHGEDGDYWRLGTGSTVPGGSFIEIAIPPDMLEAAYGNDAADRIQSIEADMELITFNPPLLIDRQVYFGLMLQPVNDPGRAVGAQVQVEQPGVFSIGQRLGGTVTITMQRSVGAQIARVRLQRDLTRNVMIVFVNDEPVGPPLEFQGDGNPVMPVLYVREGGVIVHITRWQVTLS
jgi:hypothetical protein